MVLKKILKKFKLLRYLYYFPKDILRKYKDNKLISQCYVKVKNPPNAISSFYNIHKGKRCFIVCNGPSLTAKDLDMISSEYSFASNRIYNMFPYTKWRPTYYCEADPFVSKIIEKKDIDAVLNGGSTCFLNLRCCDDYPEGTKENDNVYFYYIKPVLGIDSIKSEKSSINFSSDFSKYAYSGTTITYEMIQLALYMGFTELYLIGCDHNYKHTIETGQLTENKDIERNYPKEMGEPDKRIPMQTFNPKTTWAYESAKKYAEQHGVKIYNATRGGRLEVYQRVDFESLF